MAVKTEGQHTGEFLVSEGPGTISREVGTLKTGENVKDGTVLVSDGAGKMVASDGDSEETVLGVVLGAHDATDGDKEVPYIARLAEVKAELLHGSDDEVVIDTSALAALNIIAR